MTSHEDAEAIARTRHTIISMTRLLGGLLVVIGFLVVSGNIEWPEIVGYVLIVVGLIDAFVIPLILARRWRTPSE